MEAAMRNEIRKYGPIAKDVDLKDHPLISPSDEWWLDSWELHGRIVDLETELQIPREEQMAYSRKVAWQWGDWVQHYIKCQIVRYQQLLDQKEVEMYLK